MVASGDQEICSRKWLREERQESCLLWPYENGTIGHQASSGPVRASIIIIIIVIVRRLAYCFHGNTLTEVLVFRQWVMGLFRYSLYSTHFMKRAHRQIYAGITEYNLQIHLGCVHAWSECTHTHTHRLQHAHTCPLQTLSGCVHNAVFHKYLQAHMYFIVFTHDTYSTSITMGIRKMRFNRCYPHQTTAIHSWLMHAEWGPLLSGWGCVCNHRNIRST